MKVLIQFLLILIIIQSHVSKSPNFFRSSKISLEVSDIIKEQSTQDKLSEDTSNDCLVSESEAYKILKEKYNLNPDYIKIDQNIRFILGKCNPIIYIPGLYASRMLATINCPVLKNDFLNFVKMRLFCGDTICKDETNENEEYVIFPSIFDSPFQIRVSEKYNKYTACQGFFYTFYNSKDECPDNICNYSDGIRISYYGGTKKTKEESQCGINSLENIIYAGKMIPPLITNKLTAANFYVIIQNYRKMGYKDGFSAAGVSFDYRRYIHSNKFFENSLIYEINRLYRNTGKKVVIITHSLGGLLVLANLFRMREDIKNKIKSFVPIVPPFAGASHLLEAYLYGLTDFNTEIKIGNFFDFKVILTKFSESMYFSYAPVVAELRPQYSLIEELMKPEYNKLKLAVEELLQVEKECWDKNCPEDKVKNMTKNYYEIFGDDFPLLSDSDCQLSEEEIKFLKTNNDNKLKFRKCITNLYNVFNCPLILYEKEFSQEVPANHLLDLCGVFNSSLLYLTTPETCKPQNYQDIFGIKNNKFNKYTSLNGQKKTPLESLFNGHAKYPYNFDEFYELLDEYNAKYASKYNKTLSKSDFETEEEFQLKGKKNIEYNKKNNLLTGLPISPVDTYIIYGNYHSTDVGFVYDDGKKEKTGFDKNEYLTTGGDGTVNNYSSMLTGMKWLFEKKIKNLPQTIKLIEYCSFAGKEGNKYAYDHNTFKDKTYIALSCDCINPDNKSFNSIDCTHSAIPQDSYVIDLVKKEIITDEKNLEEFTQDKRNAIQIYDSNFDYEQSCNDALYFLNRDDMDQVDWF
jgi:hypothetical protein